MLTRDNFIGPWAGLPVAWTEDDCFDEKTYRADVARCCEAGLPGVYTAGTSGEFYAMNFDEFKEVSRATVKECHAHDTPAVIGCTSTYTRGVISRVEFAREIGADGIQVALPFWLAVADDQVVPFFKDVAAAAGELPISIYETKRAKKCLTVRQHREVVDAVSTYISVKANEGTAGLTPEGCQVLSRYVNVFVDECHWSTLGRKGANGCFSARVYWNPRVILDLWQKLQNEEWSRLSTSCSRLRSLHEFLHSEFGPKGFTDTAYDRMGGVASGFLKTSLRCRAPYVSPTKEDVDTLRQWYRDHYPEMLER